MHKICPKCGDKIGFGIKITPLREAIAKGVPHVEAVETDYLIRCSICGKEWCCLECAIESDAVSHEEYDRSEEIEEHNEPFIIKCCHCTGKKRSWEDRDEE